MCTLFIPGTDCRTLWSWLPDHGPELWDRLWHHRQALRQGKGNSEFAFGTIKHSSSFTLLSKRLFCQNMKLQSLCHKIRHWYCTYCLLISRIFYTRRYSGLLRATATDTQTAVRCPSPPPATPAAADTTPRGVWPMTTQPTGWGRCPARRVCRGYVGRSLEVINENWK